MRDSHTGCPVMFRYVLILALAATALAKPESIPSFLRQHGPGRIVNGTDAPQGKYPAMVSLEWFGSHTCGASIVNENWIMTAAHCVYGDGPTPYKALVGTVDRLTGGSRHQATQVIWHENYDSFTIENDVAVLRIDPPFTWSADVQPMDRPAQGVETPGGADATVIGWGYPYTGGSVMQHLQEVDYWIVDDAECNAVHNFEVFSTNICAYYPGGGKGQCSGDSGGPLFSGGQQVGIVSWSEKPCTIAPYPGVFTQVSSFTDWVNGHAAN